MANELTLTAFIFIVTFNSCTSNNSGTAADPIDSLASPKANASLPAPVDSITIVQQKIAFGKLNFGMTEKEYSKLPEKEKKYFQQVGDYEYMVSPKFDDSDRIYLITLTSLSKDANYIDTEIKGSTENLTRVISAKYGEGQSLQSYPSVIDFNAGFVRFIRQWEIGKKIIKVGAGEEQSGSTFFSYCEIYDQYLTNRYKSVTEIRSSGKQKNRCRKILASALFC